MEVLTSKELMKQLDKLNEFSFKYCGILYYKEGYRPEIEFIQKVLTELNVAPIHQVQIKEPISKKTQELMRHCIVINFGNEYVNIYEYDKIKDQLKKYIPKELNKQQCIAKFEYRENE